MSGSAPFTHLARHRALSSAIVAAALVAGLIAQSGPAEATHEDRTLEVTPEVERHRTGATKTLTATIDPSAEAGGVAIDFEIVSGPSARLDDNAADTPASPDLSCKIPDGSKSCSVSYKSRKAGVDDVLAWIDHDDTNSTTEADTTEQADAGGLPDEPGCPVGQCGPADTSGAGATAEPDPTDRVLAQWGQLKASQAPVEDGPVTFQTKGCDAGKDRNKRGRVIATAKACTFVYTVPPATDESEDRNFGSVWIQSQVDARRNWCMETVRTKLNVPDGARLEGVAPSKNMSVNKRRLADVTLRIGEPDQVGSVSSLSQSFYVFPATLRTRSRDGGDRQILEWKGSTRKPQAFALGIAISWLEEDGFPDFSSAGGALQRAIAKKKACFQGAVG